MKKLIIGLILAVLLVPVSCAAPAPAPAPPALAPSPDPTKFEIVEQGGRFFVVDPLDKGRIIYTGESLDDAQRKLDSLIKNFVGSENEIKNNTTEDRTKEDTFVVFNPEKAGITIDPHSGVIHEISGETTMVLEVVGKWEGTGDKVIKFSVSKSPIVINYGYTKTSSIKSSFMIFIRGGNIEINPMYRSFIDAGWQIPVERNGAVYEGTGEYELNVVSSGCNWMVKVGVEK